MTDRNPGGEKFRNILAIDARLAELEREKKQLLALRKELQESKPTLRASVALTPEQKIAIFSGLFRGL